MPTAEPTDTAEGFAASIRAATWGSHEDAAGTGFMGALFDGTLPKERYASLVAQLLAVYTVLEDAAGRWSDDPVAGPFVDDRLTRRPSLEADLAHLLGPDWPSAVVTAPATATYCARMEEVCGDWAGGFVAHHYTRYLGDLSGGPSIGRAAARAYGLDDHRGVSFYRFEDLDGPAFKASYRTLLDGAPWAPDEQARIIDEIQLAYRLNADLLADLDRGAG